MPSDPDQAERQAAAMLQLGRLDGRLSAHPLADIFLAKSRLDGAAAVAGLAGVPIERSDLEDWIAGRAPPPRASEGLNDPVSVAAVFHFAISRDEDSRDPVMRATLNVLRTVLDDRTAARTWASDDLAYFGPLWRRIRDLADQPYQGHGLPALARRVFEIASATTDAPGTDADVTTVDGRALSLAARSRGRTWLIAAAMPRMLHRAGLTMRVLPSLVLLPRYLPATPALLIEDMRSSLAKSVEKALAELDRLERIAKGRLAGLSVTSRSRVPLLARLELAYPGLRPKAVVKLLGVTPQGARKLLESLRYE